MPLLDLAALRTQVTAEQPLKGTDDPVRVLDEYPPVSHPNPSLTTTARCGFGTGGIGSSRRAECRPQITRPSTRTVLLQNSPPVGLFDSHCQIEKRRGRWGNTVRG